jgi:hypothetical protein
MRNPSLDEVIVAIEEVASVCVDRWQSGTPLSSSRDSIRQRPPRDQ